MLAIGCDQGGFELKNALLEHLKHTRLHNDANILCLGGRVIGPGTACELADIFLNTEYEGGRHATRVQMITDIEEGRL